MEFETRKNTNINYTRFKKKKKKKHNNNDQNYTIYTCKIPQERVDYRERNINI